MRAILLILVHATASFAAPADELVGRYFAEENGKQVLYARVTKMGDSFFLAQRNPAGRWFPPVQVGRFDRATLEHLTQQKVAVEVTGLGDPDVGALFKVPKGWKWEERPFVCKTGYFMLQIGGDRVNLRKEEK